MYIYIHLKLVFSTGKLKSLGFFETKTPRGTHSAEILSFQREISEKSHLSWAMKKKGPWLLRVFFGGCHPTQLYGDYKQLL